MGIEGVRLNTPHIILTEAGTVVWGDITGNITDQQDLIDFVDGSIGTIVSTIIANIQNDITNIQGDISVINGEIIDIHNDITALDGRVTVNENNISNLQNDISNINSDITDLQNDIINIRTDITNITSDITTMQGDITDIKDDIATININISNINAKITAIENDIDNLQTDVSTLQSDLTALTSRVTTNETDITTLKSDVTSIQNDITNIQADVNALQTDLTALTGRVSTNESDIADLQNNKVDKEAGKGLSSNDYTDAEKNKLSGIEAGAEVNVQSDWNETNTSADSYIQNKPDIEVADWGKISGNINDQTDLKTELDNIKSDIQTVENDITDIHIDVAAIQGDITTIQTDLLNKVDKVSGKQLSTEDYTTVEKNKLSGIETGAQKNVQSDWDQTDITKDDFINNKPSLGTMSAESKDDYVTNTALDIALAGKVTKVHAGTNIVITGTDENPTISMPGIDLPEKFTSTDTISGAVGDSKVGLAYTNVSEIVSGSTFGEKDIVVFSNGIQGQVVNYDSGAGTYDVVIVQIPEATSWGAIGGTLANQSDLKAALDSKTNDADLKPVAKSGSYNDLTDKPAIPTPAWGAIAGTLTNQTDLKNALDAKVNNSDLKAVAKSGDYSDLINKPSIPSKTSDIVNDSDFITSTDIPTNVSAFTNDSGYITNADLPDLTPYAKSDDLADVATSGDYNDLSNKPVIPTNVSAFTNDVGYLVDTDISNLVSSSDLATILLNYVKNTELATTLLSYVKSSDLTTILSSYAEKSDIPTLISQLTNDTGYLIESEVLDLITTALQGYVTNTVFNTAISDLQTSKQDKITANGILKGDGVGNITPVNKADIVALGIPAQDTVTTISQSGTGNAITSLLGSGGMFDAIKGLTFVTDDRIQLVSSLPPTPIANVLYLIPE